MLNSRASSPVPGEPMPGEQRLRMLRNMTCLATEAARRLLVNGIAVIEADPTTGHGNFAGDCRALSPAELLNRTYVDSASLRLR